MVPRPHRTSASAAAAGVLAVALLLAPPIALGGPPNAPGLPAPDGRIITVTTEPQLQQAVRSLSSGTTIVIRPGTYRLTATLGVKGPLRNVTIRGATGNRDEVVLLGPG